MEHQFFLDRLSAYFDNELKNEEHVIVHQHIEGCEECKKQLLELEKLENLISSNSELSENDYWEQSAQKIESAINKNTESETIPVTKQLSSSSIWWKLTGVAASLVLVAIFAFEQKDTNDELLKDNIKSPVNVYQKDIEESIPVIVDTATDENLSVGAIELQDKELSGRQIEIQTIETEQTSPAAAKPVDKLLPKQKQKIKTEPKKSESTKVKEEDIVSFDEQLSKYAPDIGKPVEKLRSSPKKTKMKGSYKTTSSFSETLQQSLDSNISTSADKTKLDYWWRKVFIYSEQLEMQQKKNSVRYLKSAKSDTSNKKAELSHSDKNLLYKQLFEAYYNIAILTTDSTEEKQAVDFLTKYSVSVGNSYNVYALRFLELYKTERSKQKFEKE